MNASFICKGEVLSVEGEFSDLKIIFSKMRTVVKKSMKYCKLYKVLQIIGIYKLLSTF